MTFHRIGPPALPYPQSNRPFDKVLVANRGEIAVRVIRGCAEMGIRTVAVYSDADRDALHVRYAREAVHIGPAAATESYLNIERIIDAAKQTGAEAIHPGYGFLSENPNFARAVKEAGLTFIGPPAEAMEALGDKVRARELMIDAGVPVVPGTPPLSDDVETVLEQAEKIGFPVLLKAAAGGGGKGMRVVRNADELPSLLAQAKGEAGSSFGNATVFMERFVQRPRHIEVQVLGDHHGQIIHLGERECSIQRRHQKLIEEAPSPVLTEEERDYVGSLGVKAVQAAGYHSAGTVEFLRDEDGSFYFMEVNARLQVEHPVTEIVTGVDLVKAMISIAAGNPLPIRQEDIKMTGHAIECRIIAEDYRRNFMPSPGTIRSMRTPAGPGIRYDDGTYPGYAVPVFYDPMISKLISFGHDRREAIVRMARALEETRIDGLTTSIPFQRKVMGHPAFMAGEMSTHFLEEHPELFEPDSDDWLQEIAVIAAAVAHLRRLESGARDRDGAQQQAGSGRSAWRWGATGWKR